MSRELENTAKMSAEKWLIGDYDAVTKDEVQRLMTSDLGELTESFYKTLEFGTGGLRGIMGVGTNRMNKYTVGMATQGYANYLRSQFPSEKVAVAIGFDSRNNSAFFADITAKIFAANGMRVFLFNSLRPTPELSFAIRHFGCKGGVVITASHNPKEYNGYKAYWEDGGQVTTPHDTNIIAEVNKITSPDQVKWSGQAENIEILNESFDEIYLSKLSTLLLSPEAVGHQRDMKIVYTPIHGSGVRLVPEMLRRTGFTNVMIVNEQAVLDGNFPTVVSPNPEEKSAMQMALDLAQSESADLVLATDPDADRIGIAIRNDKGEYILLNGNQTGSLLTYYILQRWKDLGKLNGNQYIVKTIVTTELIAKIAKAYGVEYFDVLTGFKYIAEVIREFEGKKQYICGGEESYGFLVGDFVRDKDAVISAAMIAEMAAWAKDRGLSMFDLLAETYIKYGFYKEALVSITKKGSDGQREIVKMMQDYRTSSPKELAGSRVVAIKDYLTHEHTDLLTGTKALIKQPKSDVLQFITADGTVVSVRPSGTEPKIKFYFCVSAALCCKEKLHEVEATLDDKISRIKRDLNLI